MSQLVKDISLVGLVLAFCLIFWSGWPDVATASAYIWTDSDGSPHFSDTPPAKGPYEHRDFTRTTSGLFQKARELAIMWYHSSPFGGRCDMGDMRRIERLYQELWNEAQRELQLCKEGWENSCRTLNIPVHIAILYSTSLLQSYLPPRDIRQMRESGYDSRDRRWNCQ